MDKDEEKKSEGRFADAVKVALDKMETTNWNIFGPVLEIKEQDVQAIMWKTFQGGYEMHFFDMVSIASQLRGHAILAEAVFAGGKCTKFECLSTRFGRSLANQLLARKHISKSPTILSISMKEASRRANRAMYERKKKDKQKRKGGE